MPLKFNSKKNRRYTPSRVRNNKSHKNEEKNKTEIKTPRKTKIINEESISYKNEVKNTYEIDKSNIIQIKNEQESISASVHDNN